MVINAKIGLIIIWDLAEAVCMFVVEAGFGLFLQALRSYSQNSDYVNTEMSFNTRNLIVNAHNVMREELHCRWQHLNYAL